MGSLPNKEVLVEEVKERVLATLKCDDDRRMRQKNLIISGIAFLNKVEVVVVTRILNLYKLVERKVGLRVED